jgi:glycerophosphoryl diester phosphodiesterase
MLSLDRRRGAPLCIGHRGAAALAPENTLESFRVAVEAGVDLIEFDVLRLEAGPLVVAHSDDLHEVSHGAASGTVRDQTLAALLELAPALPTLDAALEFFVDEAPDVGVHLDLKDAAALEGILEALRRHGLVERTLVSSFHGAAIRRLASLEPRLRAGVSFPRDRLHISRRRGSAPFIRLGLGAVRPIAPALARALLVRSRASALVLHHALLGDRTVRHVHARGLPVIAWTVDDPSELRRLDRIGVDAVVVNNPSVFASTLQA